MVPFDQRSCFHAGPRTGLAGKNAFLFDEQELGVMPKCSNMLCKTVLCSVPEFLDLERMFGVDDLCYDFF